MRGSEEDPWSQLQVSAEEAQQFLRDLTITECQVLYWFCQGLTPPQIAEKLFMSPRSVFGHMENIYPTLCIDDLQRSQRYHALNRLYCPLLEERVADPETDCEKLSKRRRGRRRKPKGNVALTIWRDVQAGLIPLQRETDSMVPLPEWDEDSEWPSIIEVLPAQRPRWRDPLLLLLGALTGAALLIVGLRVTGIWPAGRGEPPVPTQVAELTERPATGQTVGPAPSSTPSPQPTHTPHPTHIPLTPEPTHTLYPVQPTYTPLPTFTSYIIIETPAPTIVVPTPRPDQQDPPPGSMVYGGQAFTKGSVSVVAEREAAIGEEGIEIEFQVHNGTNRQIVVDWTPSAIRLRDNTGHVYHQKDGDTGECLAFYQFALAAGKSYKIEGWHFCGSEIDWNTSTYTPFVGPISAEAEYLIFHVDEFAGLTDLNWRYDIR
jgi:hypothetical protein